MFSESLGRTQFLLLFLLADALLLFFKLVKLVCNALFTHLYSYHLHHLCQVVYVVHGSLLVDFRRVKLLSDVLLSSKNQLYIVLSHKSQRGAAAACPSSASNSMHVVLRTLRHVKVQHELYTRDVQATRGYVCGHKDTDSL